MNHFDGGLLDSEGEHRIVTLDQAVATVQGSGCLMCRWVAAGMVLACRAEARFRGEDGAEVMAAAERIREGAMPTRHTWV